MKKSDLTITVVSLVLLVFTGVLTFQSGISLDARHSFETYFYNTRYYLFGIGGLAVLLLFLGMSQLIVNISRKRELP